MLRAKDARVVIALVLAFFVLSTAATSFVSNRQDIPAASTRAIGIPADSYDIALVGHDSASNSETIIGPEVTAPPSTADGDESAVGSVVYDYDDSTNLARSSPRLDDQALAPQRALPTSSLPSPSQAADLVRGATPVGSALKNDAFHRAATFAADDIAANGSVFRFISGDGVERTLIQAPGGMNGVAGRFEWIVDDFGNLTHQTFIKGGSINGVPNVP